MSTGIVYVRINKYIEVSFCMPQKVFKRLHPHLTVEPEAIFSCLVPILSNHYLTLLTKKPNYARVGCPWHVLMA
jgi:hypothetical protein